MSDDPFALFDLWFSEAKLSELNDPEAMAVATADARGRPSVRMCLLKAHGPQGFTFYSNSQSRKGAELEANPVAALLFHWKSLRRQVRIEGRVERVSGAEADAYFESRPRDAQIGAWASDQSRPLDHRSTFEQRVAEFGRKFESSAISRPPHWYGYRVVPEAIEFWSDRPFRLHERRLFTRSGTVWTEGLLYP